MGMLCEQSYDEYRGRGGPTPPRNLARLLRSTASVAQRFKQLHPRMKSCENGVLLHEQIDPWWSLARFVQSASERAHMTGESHQMAGRRSIGQYSRGAPERLLRFSNCWKL